MYENQFYIVTKAVNSSRNRRINSNRSKNKVLWQDSIYLSRTKSYLSMIGLSQLTENRLINYLIVKFYYFISKVDNEIPVWNIIHKIKFIYTVLNFYSKLDKFFELPKWT